MCMISRHAPACERWRPFRELRQLRHQASAPSPSLAVSLRLLGKVEKKLSIGSYPDISLKQAREATYEARHSIASGGDPAFEKRSDTKGGESEARFLRLFATGESRNSGAPKKQESRKRHRTNTLFGDFGPFAGLCQNPNKIKY